MNFTEGLPKPAEGGGNERKSMPRGVLLLVVTAICVTLIAVAAAVFFFVKYDGAKDDSSNAADIQERISSKVARLYDTPNEEPTIARVNDKDKLQKQEGDFFDKAKDGDFVVVYAQAQIAVLYRESTDKIINTGPIDLEQTPGIDSSQ